MIKGNEVGSILGSAANAGMAGFAVGNVPGAIAGAVIGGAAAAFKADTNDPTTVYGVSNSIQGAGVSQGIYQDAPASERKQSVYSYTKENKNAKLASTLSNVVDVSAMAINTIGPGMKGTPKPQQTGITKPQQTGTTLASLTSSGLNLNQRIPLVHSFNSLLGNEPMVSSQVSNQVNSFRQSSVDLEEKLRLQSFFATGNPGFKPMPRKWNPYKTSIL